MHDIRVTLKLSSRDLPAVPVVLDPILTRRMRPHQREGESRLKRLLYP
jgi:hypothetical protein